MKYSRRNKGYALAGTMIFLLIVMIMWISVPRQMDTNLMLENHLQAQNEYYQGSIRALSWGLKLCETGYPYTGYSSTSYWVPVGTDSQQKFVITYERLSPYVKLISQYPYFELLYNYNVTARPFVEGTDDSIQQAPSTFGS